MAVEAVTAGRVVAWIVSLPTEDLSCDPQIRGSALLSTCLPEVQALRRMPRLKAIARIINHQTEWWDGTGQPAGLAGEEIPLESRILRLVAHFEHRLTQRAKENQILARGDLNSGVE